MNGRFDIWAYGVLFGTVLVVVVEAAVFSWDFAVNWPTRPKECVERSASATSAQRPVKLSDWSFENCPPTFVSDLNESEKRRVDEAVDDGDPVYGCQRYVGALYAIYEDRYPRFPIMDRPKFARAKFDTALILLPGAPSDGCLVGGFFQQLEADIGASPPTQVCTLTPDASEVSDHLAIRLRAIKRVIDERKVKVIEQLRQFSYLSDSLRLHDDVLYYSSLMLTGTDADDELRRDYIDIQTSRMPAVRKAFVEAAAKRGDFDAVLQTTPPCSAHTWTPRKRRRS